MAATKKKILMIIGLYSPEVGGAEQECRRLSAKFSELGHDVCILTQYRQGLPAQENIDDIEVFRYIKGWHLFELTYMLSVLSFLFKNRHRFDTVLCFGLYLFTAPAVLFCRSTGRKILFRLEDMGRTGDFTRIAKLKWGPFIRACARRANGAVAISGEIEKELLHNGFPAGRIFRIPNSVNTELYSPDAGMKNSARPVISFIGRLHPKKGIEIFIKALKVLKDELPDFKVYIVGDGEIKQTLQQRVTEFRLDDRVCFTGEKHDVIPYYRQSHAVVLPSFTEGLPLVLLEAMACGAPVVASKVGGIIDVMGASDEDGPESGGYCLCETGILVLPGDEQGLSKALNMLIHDPALQERLAQNARERIERCYCLDKVVERYIALM